MKILLLTKNIDNKGGQGRYSRSVVDEFSGRHLNFTVLTEYGTGHLAERAILRPLGNGFFKTAISFVVNVFRVRQAANDADILHALDGWPYSVYGYFAVFGTKKKLFITGIGTYSVSPLRGGARRFLLSRAYSAAKQILCISDYVRQKILEYLPLNNIKVVFMGTMLLPELRKSEIEDFKVKQGLEKDFPILLTVGDIKKRKGQLDSLRAAWLLRDKYSHWKYIMIGSDDDKNYMEQIRKFVADNQLDEHIKIISNMYDDWKLAAFYQVSDVFLLNSNNDGEHFEGFGLVIIEAAQFGAPTVGSDNCGIESAVWNGHSGYLTRQGDHEDIKDKILLALANRTSLSRGAADFYRNFSWKKTADKYLEFYITQS